MSEISETSYWIKFFSSAGIPPSDATNYAIAFADNRIKTNMLLDLNKEYLNELGITVLGDVIAILKHAKDVVKANPKLMKSGKRVSSPITKKSTPATRILEHYVGKPNPVIPQASTSAFIDSPSIFKSKKSDEDPYKKGSVFDRLGDNTVSSTTPDTHKVTVTLYGKSKLQGNSTGIELEKMKKRKVDLDDSSEEMEIPKKKHLPYCGVLKYSKEELVKKEKIHQKLLKQAIDASVHRRIGVVRKSVKSEGIFSKELDLISEIEEKPKKKKQSKAQML